MANNRIAYGLCKKYGIKLRKGATPYEAWEALKKNGYTANENSEEYIEPKQYRQNTSYSTIRSEEDARKKRIAAVTPQEWSLWYSAITNLKRKSRDRYLSTENGVLIQVDEKIFITGGTFEHPVLIDVYSIDEEFDIY